MASMCIIWRCIRIERIALSKDYHLGLNYQQMKTRSDKPLLEMQKPSCLKCWTSHDLPNIMALSHS